MLAVVSSISLYRYLARPISSTVARGMLVPYRWPHRIAIALVSGLLASLQIAPVQAQSRTTAYVATAWQTEEGLPSNSINATVQDREGYLWLATDAGLARFDGVRFKVFGGEDFPSLQSSRFQSLYVSRSGALWIGTRNGGLIQLHDSVVTTYLQRDGLPSRNVRSIREDAEGRLWINTISAVACFAGGKLQTYSTYRGKSVDEFFLQAQDGSMWFRSGMEVVRFGADGSISTLAGGFMVQEARDGSIWIAFEHQNRLVRYAHGVFSDVQLPTTGVRQWTGADRWQGVGMAGDPRQAVLAMAKDTDGELLLLLPTGLVRAVNGKLSPPEALQPPANIGGVPKVLSLLVDREGNRWVGTVGNGLFRFRRAPLTAYGKREGLSDAPFRAVFQDREGRLWLGGDDGLYWFDGHGFQVVPGLKDIGAIAQTKDGDLWFGGSDAVYRWRSGVVTRYRIESPSVFQILQDREGTVWVVAPTYKQIWRLCRFRDGAFEQVDADVVHVTEDRDGGLWLAGVNPPALRFVRGGKTVLYDKMRGMPPNGVHSFYQEPGGTLWFSTTTGLYRLRNGRFAAITAKNGLTTEVTSILNDGKGNLWLPSERGIFRLSLKEVDDIADGIVASMPPMSYGVAEGMKSTECNGGVPGSWKTRDGWLWFPTMRGVVAIDPDAINGPPPAVLEEAWADKVNLRGDSGTSVKPGYNTFNFTFTALSLSAPERQQFKYRLQPFDKDWVDAGTRRTAHYTNMAPGEYSFQVIAANSFGVWNYQGAGVRFVLQPHFYETRWFYLIVGTGIVLCAAGAYRLRIRGLRAREVHLEKLVDSRTGELRLEIKAREKVETSLREAREQLEDRVRERTAELRESELRFRTFVDHAADALFILDFEQGTIVDVNPQACESLGYTRQELMGISPTVFDVNMDQSTPESVAKPSAAGESVFDTHWHRRKDGTLFPVEIHTSQFWHGDRRYLLKVVRDISDRKRAGEALRQSEAYLAETQRLSHTGSWAFDLASGKYVYASEECLRIFGINAQEILPDRETIYRLIFPEDRDSVNGSFDKSIREKVDTVGEFGITLPDGTVKYIQAIRHPVLNAAGEVVKLVGTVIDITERKHAEQEHERLRQLEAELAHLNRVSMMGELAASIAHEVNQPLSGVVSNASACLRWLAGDVPDMEEARETARRIIRDGKRAAEVIARIRALAKRAETPKERLDLNETIREVLALVGDRAERNSVIIKTQFADSLSLFLGDRVQLQQVVLNLVMNAIEAMSQVEERPRELTITTRDIDGGQILVSVKDSGMGIDSNIANRIFEPFYSTKSGGMGMGLSISRSIVQIHGGRLWAAANDGPGTTFQLSLPKYNIEGTNARE